MIRNYFKNTFEPCLLDELDRIEVQSLPAGTELRHESQSFVRYTPLVLKGTIRVSRIDWNGKEILLYFIGPKQTCFLTITASLNNNFSNVSALKAICEEDTLMIPISDEQVRQWHEKYRTWRYYVTSSYNSRFTEFFSIIDAIAFQSMDSRLIDCLLSLKKENNVVSATHKELANKLGTAREVVSRLLKNLEKEGKVLLKRGQVVCLKDLTGLQNKI